MALQILDSRWGRRTKAALALVVFGIVSVAQAGQAWSQRASLVRDAEIESIIRKLATPLLQAAGLPADSVRIHLVNDSSLNAFVAGGLHMFINTGLLQRAETPNQLSGVLAHEIGHIEGGHLARTRDELRGASTTAILAAILGVAAGIASGDARVGTAVAAAGQEVALKNLLLYSRTQESSADQAAVRLLETTRQSAKGLNEFLGVLGDQEVLPESQQDPYMRSHPFSRDRVDALMRHLQKSAYTDKTDSPEALAQHARMRAKLDGFLDPTSRVLRKYPVSDQSLPALYARAVAYHRQGNIEAANSALDALLAMRPDDPYFHELKGQILFERGDGPGAIAAYRIAVDRSAGEPPIVFAYAQAVTNNAAPGELKNLIPMLEMALTREPDNGSGWRLLGTAYGKSGNMAEASLALSESEWLFGNAKLAALQAHRAQTEFKRGSPGWLRAEDLRLAAERQMRAEAERR